MSTTAFEEMYAGLQRLAEGRSRAELASRSERISESYRQFAPSSSLIADERDALAYALTRLPATFASASTVLGELQERAPKFSPASILDVGAGPGTASWAAAGRWPSARSFTLVDHNRQFLNVAAALTGESSVPSLAGAELVHADLATQGLPGASFDLVMASYSLTEIADGDVEAAVGRLWERCSGVLVIIEPGRSRDYQRLLKMRQRLIDSGAGIVAPCPHARSCPLHDADWCHFSVRLARSRDHMRVKGATMPFEDEKFSYLVAARPGLSYTPAAARILSQPVVSKFAVDLRSCAPTGLSRTAVTKRNKEAFRNARKLNWGDALNTELAAQ